MTDPTSRRTLGFVSDAVYPWNTGGKEVRHHELMTRLARRGFDVRVYTMKWWDGPRTLRRDGLTYVAIAPRLALYSGTRRSISQALVFSLCCLSLLWRRFDVLEVDAIPFLPLAPTRLVCSLRRRPMVTTWHEFWGRDYWVGYLGARGHLAAWVERTAVRLPHRIIAASEGTAERLRDLPTARPVDLRVVPNGIDASRPRRPRPTPDDDVVRLVCVGRLLEHKKVDVAVRAVELLRRAGRDARLTVVGEGPEAQQLAQLVRDLGLQDVVTMEPFLAGHDEVMELMVGADVLLFPSVREGFGMVALEAMSVGTPVVTSDHPDNMARHLVVPGENGDLFDGSPLSLATAVGRVLASRDALSAGGRRHAARYDWDRLADVAAEAYGATAPTSGRTSSSASDRSAS